MKKGARAIAVLSGMLLLVFALSIPYLGDRLTVKPRPRQPVKKAYVHEVVEGLAAQLGQGSTGDLLRIESCRIEKQHKGGFTFGAFNVLVIDQLDLVIPSKENRGDETGRVVDATGVKSRWNGLESELESLFSQYPRFSSLRINGLRITEINPSGDFRLVLQAKKVKGGLNRTLKLYQCEFLAATGQRIRCDEALLELESPFRISTGRGSYHIAGVADGFGSLLGTLAGK